MLVFCGSVVLCTIGWLVCTPSKCVYGKVVRYLRAVALKIANPRAGDITNAKTANQSKIVEYMQYGIELEDILCDFLPKPFVGPTPTPQSYDYEMAYYSSTHHGPSAVHVCSEVTLHDLSRAIMSEQVLAHLQGWAARSVTF